MKITLFLFFLQITKLLAIDVSVKDFGAKGDGYTDDRLAIQNAINAVKHANGGMVYFPEGIYLVTAPNKGEWMAQIKLCNNLKIKGEGIHKSIVKLADNQGEWDALFKGDSISNFSMLDMGFDLNGQKNQAVFPDGEIKSPYWHTPIYLTAAKNISIEHCRISKLSGIWAIYIPTKAENIVINDCIFDDIGGYTKNDWDHSTLRLDGYGPMVVTNNIFSSTFGAGTTGARTAVELHGSNISFSNNRISGFRYGVNVCSGGDQRPIEPSTHHYYADNKLVNVGTGFCIWGIGNNKIDNLVFDRNEITIDVTGWKDYFPDYSGFDVITYNKQPAPDLVRNMQITNNHITYLNTTGGTDRSYGIKLDFSNFIKAKEDWENNPKAKLEHCKISNNTISGSFSTGIYINSLVNDCEISQNTIIDPAIGQINSANKFGIKFMNSFKNLRLINNRIFVEKDNQLISGIYSDAKNEGNSTFLNNRILGEGPVKTPIFKTKFKK